MKSGVYQFLVGCFAALGSFLFGYDLAVIAEVVASDSFITLFLQENADTRSGTVVALFTGGCFLGAFSAGFSDRLGRRGTILMACCIFAVGGIIQTAGVAIGMLYAGRLIAGTGVGFLTMIIPIFQVCCTLTLHEPGLTFCRPKYHTAAFEARSRACSNCSTRLVKSLPLG